MIITTLPDSAPYVNGSGMAIKVVSPMLVAPIESNTNNICPCDFQQCEYIQKVFAEVGGEDYKNDFSAFLFKRIVASDTVVIKLFKNGNEIATITDNTYGTYINGFSSGNAEQQLYVGFKLEWENVYNLHGHGKYQVKADQVILNTTSTEESIKFLLKGYSDLAANGTVVIDTVQNGNIMSSKFDYTELLWEQSYRINGKFGGKTPILTTDTYETESYERKQIQDSVINEWTLETKLLPNLISNVINYDNILANSIFITDYNIMNEEIFRNIPVYPQEISKSNSFSGNTDRKFTYTFIDRTDDNRKRNF